jgi:hypothetical protein
MGITKDQKAMTPNLVTAARDFLDQQSVTNRAALRKELETIEQRPGREPARKVIKYYVADQYGIQREFIHPDNTAEGKIIFQLCDHRKTISPVIRELIRDLTGGLVTFEQVLPPQK